MPKKKALPLTSEEQRKRFEALAREVGARPSSEEFKKVLRITLSKGKKLPRSK